MDAYDYMRKEMDGLPRDIDAEQRLAADELVVLDAIKQLANRGEISARSARVMALYIKGMSGTVMLYGDRKQ